MAVLPILVQIAWQSPHADFFQEEGPLKVFLAPKIQWTVEPTSSTNMNNKQIPLEASFYDVSEKK